MTMGIIFPGSLNEMIQGLIHEHNFTEQSLAEAIGVSEEALQAVKRKDKFLAGVYHKLSQLYIRTLVNQYSEQDVRQSEAEKKLLP